MFMDPKKSGIEVPSPSHASEQYDVAILGTGVGGTMLAAILAKAGYRVVMIEKEAHPRFALGESMILEASEMMRLTALRFDVPEIGYLSALQTATKFISSTHGVKRNFSFVYHRPGEPQLAKEATETPIPWFPYGHELHMFRQDIDAYMFAAAVRYGAVPIQRTEVTSVKPDSAGVDLTTEDGRIFRVKFVADATGQRSVLAKQFNLRPKENPMKTHSRSLFTHMVGVKPYSAIGHSLKAQDLPSPLFEGTLHHIFKGGWIWVIPFNNHPDSTNPLCSVGLNLDPRVYPKTSSSPEEEWESFLDRYTSIKPQFEGTKIVRRWISTDRLQYTTTQAVGDRWALLAHASGAVDALFSRGLFNTTASVHAIADCLIKALKTNVFSRDNFQHIENVIHTAHGVNDRLVATSYTAFSNFNLWNAWYRVWALGACFETIRLTRAHLRYVETKDEQFLDVLHHAPFYSLGSTLAPYKQLFDDATAIVEKVHNEELEADEASRQIFKRIAAADFIPPIFQLANPQRRYLGKFNLTSYFRMVAWGKYRGPKYLRKLCFDVKPQTLITEYFKWHELALKVQKNRNYNRLTEKVVP